MTIKDLYKWALDNNVEDCDIVLQDRDTDKQYDIYWHNTDVSHNQVILRIEEI